MKYFFKMGTTTELKYQRAFGCYLVNWNRVRQRQEAFATDSWISVGFSLVSNVVMVGFMLFWIKTKTLHYMIYIA